MSLKLKVCYRDNGLTARGDVPCDPKADVSACCGIGSVCMENLFCQDIAGNSVPGSCTDQQWGIRPSQTPGCPCREFFKNNNSTINYADSITTCPDGSVCCGIRNSDCCNAGKGNARIQYKNPSAIPSATTALAAYYTGLKVTTLAVSSRPSSTAPSNNVGSNPGGDMFSNMTWPAKVGLGIGLGATSLLFLAALIFLIATWKRYARLKALARRGESGETATVKEQSPAPSDIANLMPAPLRVKKPPYVYQEPWMPSSRPTEFAPDQRFF